MARFITTTKSSEKACIPINIDLLCFFSTSHSMNPIWHRIDFYCAGQHPVYWMYEKEENRDADYILILKEFGYPLPNLSIIEEEIESDSSEEHKGGDNDDRPSGLDWLLANR